MALSTYRPTRQDIALGNGETASVRGLNLNDIALLMAAHAEKLTELYRTFESMGSALPGGDAQMTARFILQLVTDMPQLAADIIALAADEPDANQIARSLPFPVQVAALQQIGVMTFEAGGGLGNFLAALRGISDGLGISSPTNLLPASLPQKSNAGGEAKAETVS